MSGGERPKPSGMSQTGQGAGAWVQFLLHAVMTPGLLFSLCVARSGSVGWRVPLSPPSAIGFLLTAVLVGLSLPPFYPLVMAAILVVGIVRHRVNPGTGHSMDAGECALELPFGPPGLGRAVTSVLGVVGGLVVATEPGPWPGLGWWLVVGGAGQFLLFAVIERKESLIEADGRDAMLLAKQRGERMGL